MEAHFTPLTINPVSTGTCSMIYSHTVVFLFHYMMRSHEKSFQQLKSHKLSMDAILYTCQNTHELLRRGTTWWLMSPDCCSLKPTKALCLITELWHVWPLSFKISSSSLHYLKLFHDVELISHLMGQIRAHWYSVLKIASQKSWQNIIKASYCRRAACMIVHTFTFTASLYFQIKLSSVVTLCFDRANWGWFKKDRNIWFYFLLIEHS